MAFLKEDLFLEGFRRSWKQQEVIKVVSLGKMAEKHGTVP